MKHKRKTLSANDVLDAMEEMEFPSFIEPLKEGLEGMLMFVSESILSARLEI